MALAEINQSLIVWKHQQRKIDDIVDIIESFISRLMYDLETHINYGCDFNYARDMEQLESVLVDVRNDLQSLNDALEILPFWEDNKTTAKRQKK